MTKSVFTFARLRTLVIKELQAVLNDPQTRAILIMPVLLQLILFPAAATLEVRNATLGIYNEDQGAVSIELMQRFAEAKAFSRVIMFHSQEEMAQAIDRQDVLVVVHFPQDFSRKAVDGTEVAVQELLDGRRSNSAQIAASYLQTIVQSYDDERNAQAGKRTLSEVVVRNWFNPNLDYYFFVVPSLIATITTIGTLVITSLSIAREREQGTFDQLLVSPLTTEMILIGKAIPGMLVAMVQGTIILLAAIFVYQIPFQGSLPLLFGSMLFYAAALVGFGLLISSVCATQQQAFLGTFCFLMPAILLSGFVAPVDNMPVWLQTITWINPLRHFMVIVQSIFLKDISIGFVLENMWPLVIIAITTTSLAVIIFRRQTA